MLCCELLAEESEGLLLPPVLRGGGGGRPMPFGEGGRSGRPPFRLIPDVCARLGRRLKGFPAPFTARSIS